jgi:aminoglycoside phosphotransferase
MGLYVFWTIIDAVKTIVVPILTGQSTAKVVRVLQEDGLRWIEKHGVRREIDNEARILDWCAGRLPVPKVLESRAGMLKMSEIPGKNLTELPVEDAIEIIVCAIRLVHSVSIKDCPFVADWTRRIAEGETRAHAGLIDGSDFDEENRGRSIADIVRELKSFPPLPDIGCFTHGDACLQNFLAHDGQLSGIIDVGRAGIAHPAQDWALALRSVHGEFGHEAEALLWKHVPTVCADKQLLRRFRLLDELF